MTTGGDRAGVRTSKMAVIDTETTGLGAHDRIVEFACVTVVEGEIVEEYDTLIQPDRDPGPVHLHGITPSMLQTAPVFQSVAGDIAARLHGALIVAHNISFDLRMLRQETDRIPAMTFSPGTGICTYRLSGQKLSLAAQEYGIGAPDHTALQDARVTARLLVAMSDRWAGAVPTPAIFQADQPLSNFTVRRPEAPPRRGALSMLALRTAWPRTTTEAEVLYLDTLDRCLDDGELSPEERDWLSSTARALQLSEDHRMEMHRRYYDLLVRQILADGLVTQEERDLHDKVAEALMIDSGGLTGVVSEMPGKVVDLSPGMNVCFTGVAMVDGERVHRRKLEKLAEQAGLRTVDSVTKKKCDLLVAADALSRSGKAGKAHRWGIPIIDAAQFMALLSNQES